MWLRIYFFLSFFLEHGFYSFQDFGSFHEKINRMSIYTQCLINYTTVLRCWLLQRSKWWHCQLKSGSRYDFEIFLFRTVSRTENGNGKSIIRVLLLSNHCQHQQYDSVLLAFFTCQRKWSVAETRSKRLDFRNSEASFSNFFSCASAKLLWM